MDIQSELLFRFAGYNRSSLTTNAVGYSRSIQSCMLIDRIAGEMMDEAEPQRRAAIYNISTKIKRDILRKQEAQ